MGTRLIRNVLWIALVWVPLILYLFVLGADIIGWWSIRGGLGITLFVYGWPMLLVGLCAWLTLAMLRLVQKRCPVVLKPSGQPLAVGIGAYLLGCLLQLVIPASGLHPFGTYASLLDTGPLYWWPLTGLANSYTIYPPLDPRFVLLPSTEAACIKLAVLLISLLFYQRIFQLARKASVSAKFV